MLKITQLLIWFIELIKNVKKYAVEILIVYLDIAV